MFYILTNLMHQEYEQDYSLLIGTYYHNNINLHQHFVTERI